MVGCTVENFGSVCIIIPMMNQWVITELANNVVLKALTLKAQIATAADDKS